ncbi:hypothetical protein [Neotabrizicola sp. sgz301269]|uniref:hypothetical protein n=1 Tax=Neotabrizicola sp. sgz301269 TaxID=3276282 RepID=UPI00376F4C40
MGSLDDILTWAALAVIFGGTIALYAFLIGRKARDVLRAMARLRDRIDRSDDRLR